MINLLKSLCEKFEINLTNSQLEKFNIYYNFLIEYNKNVNLTSITEKNQVATKHFLDSIIVSKYIDFKGKLIDIGTGAGFPGIPLKIIDDELNVTLLDSSIKKIKFLELLVSKLGLNVDLIHSRTELVEKKYLNSYDFSIARAVAPMKRLCKYCIPFLRNGGTFVSLKGPSYESEIDDIDSKYLKNMKIYKFSYLNNTRVIIEIKV